MKTYEEMTAAVFRRREEYFTRQKRRRKWATLTGSGLCVAVLLTLCLWQGAPPSPDTEPDTSPTAPVADIMQSRLYLAKNGQQALLKEGVTLPEAYTLSVQDIRELPPAEADSLYDATCKNAESESTAHADTSTFHSHVIRRENVIIRCVRLGEIELEVDDPGSVAAISGKSYSGYGRIEFYYNSASINKGDTPYSDSEMTLTGDYYQLLLQEEEAGTGRLEINWRPSAELYNTIDENPDLPLSTFRDVFTLYVEYTDGTAEHHRIEVAFNDDGEADIRYETVTADTFVVGEKQ
ncbi:MAG: hypothetical protein IJ518_06640 [Clostridia bacterium]|nr:hypothetical protein [Clostridia bacterium]